MTLKDFALKLRKELLNNNKPEDVAKKIKSVTISEKHLTPDQIETILCYIEYPGYDPQKGLMPLNESDNSEYLKLINSIRGIIKNGK
ncbi:MAG: hypothetical protein R3Y28_06060 [Candidatus Gastranaerophilales bacterium]